MVFLFQNLHSLNLKFAFRVNTNSLIKGQWPICLSFQLTMNKLFYQSQQNILERQRSRKDLTIDSKGIGFQLLVTLDCHMFEFALFILVTNSCNNFLYFWLKNDEITTLIGFQLLVTIDCHMFEFTLFILVTNSWNEFWYFWLNNGEITILTTYKKLAM